MKNVAEQSLMTKASGEILLQRSIHSTLLANTANAQLDAESNIFLVQCLKLGETAYSHCNKY